MITRRGFLAGILAAPAAALLPGSTLQKLADYALEPSEKLLHITGEWYRYTKKENGYVFSCMVRGGRLDDLNVQIVSKKTDGLYINTDYLDLGAGDVSVRFTPLEGETASYSIGEKTNIVNGTDMWGMQLERDISPYIPTYVGPKKIPGGVEYDFNKVIA